MTTIPSLTEVIPTAIGASPRIIYALYCAEHTEQGMRYVGQTSRGAAYRLSGHRFEAGMGEASHKNNWIRKHGAENIRMTVLEDVVNGDLNERERHWISAMRHQGLALTNQLDGGAGMPGWDPSPETRAKWSEQRRGRPANVAQILALAALTEAEARSIIARADEQPATLAEEFSVNRKTITNLLRGATWGHLDRSEMPKRWTRGGRTVCKVGHDLVALGVREKGRCAECHRAWMRANYQKRKGIA